MSRKSPVTACWMSLLSLLYATAAWADGIVISEIMYNPVQDSETEADFEYVELCNTSSSNIDLSGWTLTGSKGVTLTLNTVLGGNAYLVCCANTNTIRALYGITNVAGNWTGSLDNGGETLTLSNLTGVVDKVKYNDKEPWPSATDGFGPSMERYALTAPANTSVNWSASCAPVTWQQVSWTGQLSAASAPIVFFLDYDGKCLLDDVSVKIAGTDNELVPNGTFENGMTGWIGTNNHSQSRVEAGLGRSGSAALAIQCNETRWLLKVAPYSYDVYGDATSNRIASTAPLAPLAGTNYVVSWWVKRAGIGNTIYSVMGGITNSLALGNRGTPGRINTVATSFLPIGITAVWQAYTNCPVGTANVVRVRIPSTGEVSEVRLYYQTVGTNQYRFTNGSYSNVIMGHESNDLYAATLPGVPSNWTLVRYHVVATATNGFEAMSPHLDDASTDYGYWVESSSPQTNLPNWHLLVDGNPILHPISRHVCAISPNSPPASPTQILTDFMARHRGNADYAGSLPYSGLSLEFLKSRPYNAWFATKQDDINIRHRGNDQDYYYRRVVAEPLAYDLQRTLGFPTPRWRFACFWIDGSPTITTELEGPGDAFLSGNGISTADYLSRQTTAHGRDIVAGDPALDNFDSMQSGLYHLTSTNRNVYIRTNLCYESIQHCLALLSVTGNGDQKFDWNMFQHRSAADGRWRQYPWDVDMSFDITFSNSWTSLTTLHPYYMTPAHPSIWNTNNFEPLGLPLFHPETNDVTTLPYRYRHQMTLWRYCHTLFTTNVLFPKLDTIQATLAPAYLQIRPYVTGNRTNTLNTEVSNVKNFIISRRNFFLEGEWSDKMTNIWTAANVYTPSNIVVTEIMHTPSNGVKYIELHNNGTQSVDLSHWLLRSGGTNLYLPFGTMMAPDAYLVLVASGPGLTNAYAELGASATLVERYPGTGLWDWPIVFTSATEYASRVVELPGLTVPDKGTTLELRDVISNRIETITYTNIPPWPAGSGVSLERIVPTSTDTTASAWRESTVIGTPGTLNTATADTDLDGLPDSLEQRIMAASSGTLTNLGQVTPGDDFDADGIVNSNEFLLGTDPTLPDKEFAALHIGLVDGGIAVTFPTLPATGTLYTTYSGRYYTLQHSPDLAGIPWSNVTSYTDLPALGIIGYTNAIPPSFEAYRFKTELRPIRP